MKFFLKKLKKNVEIDSEDDDNTKKNKKKNDLVIYMSLYNRHPSENDHDYLMKGKDLYLHIKKPPNHQSDLLFLAFYSQNGCRIYF